MKNYTTPVKVEILSKNGKKSFVYRCEKIGTKKVLFFATNEDNKRLTSNLFARKYDAVNISRQYLNN